MSGSPVPCLLHGVGHRFDGPWLFRGLEASLEPGEVYALTGPSGSGKSTLLGIIAGWIAPAEGRVELPPGARIGWVFQNPHGSPRRAAIDQLALPLLAQGLEPEEADERAAALLARFRLEHLRDGRAFRSLSGGEAQRLMLAIGIAAGPEVLLVDEPTAQLDQTTAAAVNETIARMAEEGVIVVVATHDERTRRACSAELRLADHEARPDDRAGAA